MTISSNVRKVGPFTGTGTVTVFTFNFKVFQASDLYVVKADSDGKETVLVLNSDYTATLNSNQDSNPGGSITLASALATGYTMIISSTVGNLQPTDLTNQGGFYPSVITDALDRATIQIQQLQETVDRSAKLPITNDTDAAQLTADIVLLANNIAELDVLYANINDIQTVAADLNEPVSEINTVAGSITNVNIVGNDIANVNTVAGNTTNINTVAGNTANVTTVAGISGNVTTVAGNTTNINTVAGNTANVTTVAGISGNVTTVAGISSSVTSVAGNATNINAVNANKANIDTVAGKATEVTTVAGIADNVTTVAGDTENIDTVATNISDVNTVAANVADITNFASVYYGPSETDPSARRDGSALEQGDMYFNTISEKLRVYTSAGWTESVSGSVFVYDFDGDGSTVRFPVPITPTDENVTQVFISGVYQNKTSYDIDGADLVFSSAPPSGTGNIEVVVMNTLPLGSVDWDLIVGKPFIDSTIYITSDTVLSDVMDQCNVIKGGMFNVAAGVTLTIDVPFSCGLFQCFSGAGSVTFGSGSVVEVYPEWWGAVADGVTDSTTAIQSAVNTFLPVLLQTGTYIIYQNIVIPPDTTGKVKIAGSGLNTQIKAAQSRGVTKILDFGASPMSLCVVRDLVLNGAGDGTADASTFVTYGIYGESVSHSRFINIKVTAFSNTGIVVKDGWSNYFEDVTTMYCAVGFKGYSAFNNNIFNHCKFWLNQVGIYLGSGLGTVFSNCLFEANAKTGAFLLSSGVEFNACYFEGNAKVNASGLFPAGITAGVSVTTPATTIKADVIIDGGSSLPTSAHPISISTLAISSPCNGIAFNGCTTAVYASAAESFIYMVACVGVGVSNCYNTTTAVPTVRTYQNSLYSKVQKINISDVEGFSVVWTFDNAADGRRVSGIDPQSLLVSTADKANYAETNFLKWKTGGTVVGTFTRKNIADRRGLLTPVWELAYASTSTSEIRGFTMNPADYPENIGKNFIAILDVKAAAANTQITLYGKTQPDGSFNIADTSWHTYACFFTWPASGGPFFMGGLSKTGNTGSVYIANPILIEVGADYKAILSAMKANKVFDGSAAPSAGDWLLADKIYNTSPTSAGYIGWVCTVAGTPGTWSGFGVIA